MDLFLEDRHVARGLHDLVVVVVPGRQAWQARPNDASRVHVEVFPRGGVFLDIRGRESAFRVGPRPPVCAFAQMTAPQRLWNAKSLACVFAVVSTGNWKDGQALAAVTPAKCLEMPSARMTAVMRVSSAAFDAVPQPRAKALDFGRGHHFAKEMLHGRLIGINGPVGEKLRIDEWGRLGVRVGVVDLIGDRPYHLRIQDVIQERVRGIGVRRFTRFAGCSSQRVPARLMASARLACRRLSSSSVQVTAIVRLPLR